MLKIGEFSKLSQLTVKALRFYETQGLLLPHEVDKWTGYRYYEPEQLAIAARIKAYRSLDLSIDDIKAIFDGADAHKILERKADELQNQKTDIDAKLSILKNILEEQKMDYQVTLKTIPECIVYVAEATLKKYGDIMDWIPAVGAECLKLNPDLKCAEPPYEFCEFTDNEYRESDIHVRHFEAVTSKGVGNDKIKFEVLPPVKVLSVYHKGPYDSITEAYAFIVGYAKEHGYEIAATPRECYIDGIWNKEDAADWLTEIQLPIK